MIVLICIILPQAVSVIAICSMGSIETDCSTSPDVAKEIKSGTAALTTEQGNLPHQVGQESNVSTRAMRVINHHPVQYTYVVLPTQVLKIPYGA